MPETGVVMRQVQIDLGGTAPASFDNAAVDGLALVLGQEAFAGIEASDVMVGVA